MAQKVYHNYKGSIEAFEFNKLFLGLLAPGRYRGFDGFTATGSLTFELLHTTTGINQTTQALGLTTPTGIAMTKQGNVVQEDANITGLSIGTNGANAFERIDVVYLEHEHTLVIGGAPAIYGVIQGANGGPVEPALTNPNKQIKLGTLRIPASVTDLTTTLFVPSVTPGMGGRTGIYGENQNLFNRIPTTVVAGAAAYDSGAAKKVTPSWSGNFYDVSLGSAAQQVKYIDPIDPLTRQLIPGGTVVYFSFSHQLELLAWDLSATRNILLPGGGATMNVPDSSNTWHRFVYFSGFFIYEGSVGDHELRILAAEASLALKANIAQEAFIVVGSGGGAPAFGANWSASAGDTVGFYKDTLGIVHLEGRLKKDAGVNYNAFILPAGYRPTIGFGRYPSVNTSDLSNYSIIISSGGVVTISNAVDTLEVAFDGITFRAA